MRNFEFKNPIQKFKEGRKIVKAQHGRRAPGGDTYIRTNANGTQTTFTSAFPLRRYTDYIENHNVSAQGRYNAAVRRGERDPELDATPVWQRTAAPAEAPIETPAETPAAAPAGNTRTGGRVRSTVRRPKFVSRLGDLNLTAEEKAFLEGQGVNVNDATSMQNFILKNAANADLGARKGAGIADGYFGDKSLKAFQALRNQGIFTPKIDAQETPAPVVEQPVDAPDFGYATNQDYSNGSQFKGLGFNNYQGLLLYAQNSQDQFAKDLRQRFGNRLTDQNYVESQLGISGKYRGGSAGDFGDMARSMQAWKTGVNNEFDKKRADYAQARLAERTGSDGTVYSSPEMMKKFDGINISPGIKFGRNKLDFSNMQFNVNFGNMGANTLGNIGTLGNTGLS